MNIDLPGEAYLPRGYVPDMRPKIDLYRRLARLTTRGGGRRLCAASWPTGSGRCREVVEHLLELARLRIWAHGWGVQEIRLEDRYAVLGYTSREKLTRLVEKSQRAAAGGGCAECLSAAGERRGRSGGKVFAEVKALYDRSGRR